MECDEVLREPKGPPCKKIKSKTTSMLVCNHSAILWNGWLLRKGQHSSVRLMKSGTDFTKNLFLAPINLDGAKGGIGPTWEHEKINMELRNRAKADSNQALAR